jgi:hypothetical protein
LVTSVAERDTISAPNKERLWNVAGTHVETNSADIVNSLRGGYRRRGTSRVWGSVMDRLFTR